MRDTSVPAHDGATSNTATRQWPRRDFIKVAAGATLTGVLGHPLESPAAKALEPWPPGIKISLQISTNATDEDLQFAQQLGVEYVNIPSGGDKATLTKRMFNALRDQIEPTIAAISTILVVLSVLAVAALELLRSRKAQAG